MEAAAAIVAAKKKTPPTSNAKSNDKKKRRMGLWQFFTVILKWLLDDKMCGQNEITEPTNLLCHNIAGKKNGKKLD